EVYWESLIGNADAVIIGGGQLFTDNLFYFPIRIDLVVDIARRNNKPYAIIGCGVGKNISRQGVKIYERVVDQAAYVSLRDYGSLSNIRSYINPRLQINVYPDLAFAMRDTVAKKAIVKRGGTCGFNVIPL